MSNRLFLDTKEIQIILNRLACQLREKHQDFSNSILIGIQPRGAVLAKRLVHSWEDIWKRLNMGFDITFLDDLQQKSVVCQQKPDGLIENKKWY